MTTVDGITKEMTTLDGLDKKALEGERVAHASASHVAMFPSPILHSSAKRPIDVARGRICAPTILDMENGGS